MPYLPSMQAVSNEYDYGVRVILARPHPHALTHTRAKSDASNDTTLSPVLVLARRIDVAAVVLPTSIHTGCRHETICGLHPLFPLLSAAQPRTPCPYMTVHASRSYLPIWLATRLESDLGPSVHWSLLPGANCRQLPGSTRSCSQGLD